MLFSFRKKTADHLAVKQAAENLMLTHGATTTLEIKNLLRNQGFVAFQADISRMMNDIAQAQGWGFFWTGRFRVYFMEMEESAFGRKQEIGFSLN